MWWYVGAGATVGCVAVHFAYSKKSQSATNSISQELSKIETVGGLIQLLQRLGRRSPTEDLVQMIVDSVKSDGISESTLLSLSLLHKQYGNDLGVNGYAINMLWSSITHAIQTDGVVIFCD